jgi:glycosyltransferase involved in cell wall biosynthesis
MIGTKSQKRNWNLSEVCLEKMNLKSVGAIYRNLKPCYKNVICIIAILSLGLISSTWFDGNYLICAGDFNFSRRFEKAFCYAFSWIFGSSPFALLVVLESSEIFVFPRHNETWLIAVCEAIACVLPIIAYNLLVYEEIYGEDISKAPLGKLDKFADAIMHFLKNDKLIRTFGLKGQNFVQRHDWGEVAQRGHQLMINVQDKA